jgi:hypothetical protein
VIGRREDQDARSDMKHQLFMFYFCFILYYFVLLYFLRWDEE